MVRVGGPVKITMSRYDARGEPEPLSRVSRVTWWKEGVRVSSDARTRQVSLVFSVFKLIIFNNLNNYLFLSFRFSSFSVKAMEIYVGVSFLTDTHRRRIYSHYQQREPQRCRRLLCAPKERAAERGWLSCGRQR